MLRMNHTMVLAIAVVTGVVIGSVLYRIGLTNLVSSGLVGGFIVLLASYFDLVFERAEQKTRVEQAFGLLGRAHDTLKAEADLTRRALVELKAHVDDRIAKRNDRIVSEVKVLESLVQSIAENVATRARDVRIDSYDRDDRRRLTHSQPQRRNEDETMLLEAVRRALEENRVDLYLQPIVSLPQRRLRYYEALSRLRTEDGTIIMPSQYIRVAENAGLMSVVDNVLLFRCIQIMRGVAQRNKDIGVFCNISRETLQDANFFRQFLDFMQHNRELASQLYFEISQDTFDKAGPTEQTHLAQLAELGFGFSIDKLKTLDIDFAKARHRQVRFVKVPAALLLADPAASGMKVHPADLKELMLRHGLYMIGEKLEHERDVVNMLDYDVDFGQGFLFGEPKPIRETVLGGAPAPKAPAPTASGYGRPRMVANGR